MRTAIPLDLGAIADACSRCGAVRLRVFGSVLTGDFGKSSDVDFLVEFGVDRENPYHDYFDLKSLLEGIVGRRVDLVVEGALKNPYLARSIVDSAEDVFAA